MQSGSGYMYECSGTIDLKYEIEMVVYIHFYVPSTLQDARPVNINDCMMHGLDLRSSLAEIQGQFVRDFLCDADG